MAYKQQKVISHHCGGWKRDIRALAESVSREGLGGRCLSRELSGPSFMRALIPFMRVLPSGPTYLPKGPL